MEAPPPLLPPWLLWTAPDTLPDEELRMGRVASCSSTSKLTRLELEPLGLLTLPVVDCRLLYSTPGAPATLRRLRFLGVVSWANNAPLPNAEDKPVLGLPSPPLPVRDREPEA